jgi:hypothetical protein
VVAGAWGAALGYLDAATEEMMDTEYPSMMQMSEVEE